MKNLILLLLFTMIGGLSVYGQQVPQGMRYQAVARDLDGKVIENQPISLQISLKAGERGEILYTEQHRVETNSLGLFVVTVGGGKAIKGEFASIPWSIADIWLDIDMDDQGGQRFLAINSSQLLAVPYAFHAGTAGSLTGEANESQKNGPQFYWSISGNVGTFPTNHYMGTRDYKDLIFKTNSIKRMTITKDGLIDIDGSLNVGDNLTVGNNALIGNDLRVDRDVSIGRDLEVERNTEMDGTLGVDGITTLRNPAESTTKDNGSLVVEGGVGIEKNVNIGGNTEIDGTLGVDGVTTLKNTTESTTKDNGSLVVEGGVGIEKNVNIGGNTEVDGTLGVDGVTTLKNTMESTTKDNGSLVVEGGVGIEKNVNIGGNTEVDGTLGVDGVTTLKNTTESTTKDNGSLVVEGGVGIEKNVNIGGNTELDGTLGVDGVTTLKNTTESTTKDNGSLVVEGGVGVEKNINIGGNSAVTGNSTIGGTLGVNGVATFNNTTQSTTKDNGAVIIEGGIGIEKNINVGGNSFVTGTSTVNGTTGLNGQVTIAASVGGGDGSYGAYPLRVEGSAQGIAVKINAATPNGSNNFITFFDSGNTARGRIEGQTAGEVATSPEYIFETSILTAEIIAAGVNIGLSLLPNGCAGVGAVACPPEPSVVAIAIAEEILAIANQAAYQVFAFANLGVTYQSGSADYAEFLERRIVTETMTPGDIVGVIGGKISKQTANASQYLVISTNPAMLGNMQSPIDETRFEKVAFMGQVPVKVRGQVNVGDYIILSGLNDGTGIGISPDQITPKQYREIVGIAWSSAPAGSRVSLINLAIGLNTNDIAQVVEDQQMQIFKLEQEFSLLEKRLTALESGKQITTTQDMEAPSSPSGEVVYNQMQESLNVEQIEEAILLLKDTYTARGFDINSHVGLRKLFNDATFRMEIIQNVQQNYRVTRRNLLEMESGKY